MAKLARRESSILFFLMFYAACFHVGACLLRSHNCDPPSSVICEIGLHGGCTLQIGTKSLRPCPTLPISKFRCGSLSPLRRIEQPDGIASSVPVHQLADIPSPTFAIATAHSDSVLITSTSVLHVVPGSPIRYLGVVGAVVAAVGAGVAVIGAGVCVVGAGVCVVGAGVGVVGAGVDVVGAGVVVVGAGVVVLGAGVCVVGAGDGVVGAGVDVVGAGVTFNLQIGRRSCRPLPKPGAPFRCGCLSRPSRTEQPAGIFACVPVQKGDAVDQSRLRSASSHSDCVRTTWASVSHTFDVPPS